MSIKFSFFWCCLTLVVISACNPGKKLPVIEKNYSDAELIAALEKHNYHYTWFHAKGDVNIDGFDQSHRVQSILRIKADSAIWMVFKKFEIEAIRFLMTPEMYTVLFRLENGYMKGMTPSIRNQLGIDVPFRDLQDWLFGNVYLPGSSHVEISQDQSFATLRFSEKGWLITYTLDKMDLQLTKATLQQNSGATIIMKFSKYKILPTGETVAFYREINMVSPEGEVAEMRLDFSEIELNVPKELKFVVPSHYSEFE